MKIHAALLLVVAALVSLAAQQQPRELPPPGERMPEGYHCKRPDVTISKGEKAAHCTCTYSCHVNPDGSVDEREDSTCLANCKEKQQTCSCWPEGDPAHPCTASHGGNARTKMDGTVVAVARRK